MCERADCRRARGRGEATRSIVCNVCRYDGISLGASAAQRDAPNRRHAECRVRAHARTCGATPRYAALRSQAASQRGHGLVVLVSGEGRVPRVRRHDLDNAPPVCSTSATDSGLALGNRAMATPSCANTHARTRQRKEIPFGLFANGCYVPVSHRLTMQWRQR